MGRGIATDRTACVRSHTNQNIKPGAWETLGRIACSSVEV